MEDTDQLRAEIARLRLQNSQLMRENESLMGHLYDEVDGSDGEDSFMDTYGRVSALSDVFEDQEFVDADQQTNSHTEDDSVTDGAGGNMGLPQMVLSPSMKGKRPNNTSLTSNNVSRGRTGSFNPRSSLSSSLHKRFIRHRSRTSSSIYSETPLQIDRQTHGFRIDENVLFNAHYQQPLTEHDASVFQVSCVEVHWAEYIQRFKELRQAMDETLFAESGNRDSSMTEQQQDRSSKTDKVNTNTNRNSTTNNNQASRSSSVANVSDADKRRTSSVVSSASKIDMAAMKRQLLEENEVRRGKERILEKAFLSGLETWKYCPSVDQLNNQDVMTDPKEHHSVLQGQPSEDSKRVESSHIQQFCFPAGVSVKYVSKSAVEYLVGEKHDQYHIMQFADSNGHQSYACCLTVTKVVRAPSEAVLDALHYAYSKQRPAAIIRKFMRKVVKYIKKRRWENASEGVLTNRFTLQHLSDERRHGPDDLSDSSTPQNRSATSRMMAMFGDSSTTTNRNSTSSTTGSTYSSYFGMSSSTPAATGGAPMNDDVPQSTFFGRMKARLGYSDTPADKPPTKEEQRKLRASEAAAARDFFARQERKSLTLGATPDKEGDENKSESEDKEASSGSPKGRLEGVVRVRGPSHDFTVLPEPVDEPSVNRTSVQVKTSVDLLEQDSEEDSNIRDSGNQSYGTMGESRLSNSAGEDASNQRLEDLLSLDAPLSSLNNSPNNDEHDSNNNATTTGGEGAKVPPSKRMSLSLRSRAGVPITLSYDGPGKRERNASYEESNSNKSSTKSTTNTTGIADASHDHDHSNVELLEAMSDAIIVDNNDVPSTAKNTTLTDDSSDAENPHISSDATVTVKNLGGLETLTTLNESEVSHDSVKVTWETLNDNTTQTHLSSTSLDDTDEVADSEGGEPKGDQAFDVFGDTYLDTLPEQHRNKRVVAEVAYCLISPHPIQSLGFTVLKAIADAERELCNDMKASSRVGNDHVRFGWNATNGSKDQQVQAKGTQNMHTDEGKYGWNAPSSEKSTSGTSGRNRTDSSISLTSNMTKIINQGDLFSLRYHFIRKVHLQFVYWAHAGGLAEQLAYSFGSVPSVLASKVIPTRKTQLKRFRNFKKGQANYRKTSLSGTERYKSKPNGATTGREFTKPTTTTTTTSSSSQGTTADNTILTDASKDTDKPSSSKRKMSGTTKDGAYNKMAIGDLQHIDIEHSLMHIDMPHYLSASSAPGSREGGEGEGESASASTSATALSGMFQIDLSKLPSNDELAAVVTFSYLNSSIIFKLINLLLMEKSLVVCGKHPGIVSMVALGIKNLILPFKWEGVFVPLLPHSARELFGAPVPFILGTTIPPREKDVSYSSAILHLQEEGPDLTFADDGDEEGEGGDDEEGEEEGREGQQQGGAAKKSTTTTKSATKDTRLRAFSATSIDSTYPIALRSNPLLHIMSLHTLKLPTLPETVSWFIRLPDSINADMPHSEGLERKIENTRKFLRHCRARYVFRNKIKPSVKLDMHYVTSISMNEKRAILDLSKAIYEHNLRFCGDSSDPMAWKRYIKRNNDTGEEEFYPNWFMEPIRRQIEFQEAVVRTQLFVGYIDGARIESENKDFYRIFIRDFINFRLHLAKMKIQREQGDD